MLLLVIVLGFQKFINSERFLFVVSIIGGIALIVMGAILILGSPKMNMVEKEGNPGFNKGLFAGGFLFSGISPGFIVWWATIGLSTIVMALLYGVVGLVILMTGHWLADIAWHWSLSYAVDKGKRYLTDKSYRNIIRFFSLLLILLGLHLFLR